MSRPISVGLVVVLPHELVPELPLELVREILTLLPVKSLMRCKCVSKIWLSIITDPSFAAGYRCGFRGLLLSVPPFHRLADEWRLLYASLDFEGQPSFRFSGEVIMTHSDFADQRGELMGRTEIVNGVLCFYYREYSYLFNPATREKLELPFSTGDGATKSKACSYHFGYDPVNKLYKLLKICPVYDDYPFFEDDNWVPKVDRHFEKDDKNYKKIIFVEKDDRDYKERIFVENLRCEILTIGLDTSWRILPSLPPMEMSSLRSRCIDGVLYWLELDPESAMEIAKHLVAFDLVEEKFQFIATPANPGAGFNMFTFSPGLALSSGNKIYHYGGGQWKEQKLTFKLPTTPRSPWPLRFHGILPNGEMLITRLGKYGDYLYDPTKKTLQKLQHLQDTFSMRIYDALNEGSYYEENIIPLKCLARREE